jgi:hypothetical protein
MDVLSLMCPHCGETVEFEVAEDDRGRMVADCPVCCRPCVLTISRDEWGDPDVSIEQE